MKIVNRFIVFVKKYRYDKDICKKLHNGKVDGMKKALIVGAGKGGTALLKIFEQAATMEVAAVVDRNDRAPGLELAKTMNIPTGSDWRPFLTNDIDIVIEATGEKDVFEQIRKKRQKKHRRDPRRSSIYYR